MKSKLITLVLLLLTQLSHASEKLSVLVEDWYPFNYQDGDEIVGSSTDYVKRLLEHAQLDYEIEIREWSQAFSILKSEPNTLLYSTFKTEKRADMFHWICPINEPVYSSAYALADNTQVTAATLEQLKAYSVGITQDTYPFHRFKDLGFIEGENIQVTKNNSSNLGMLLRGRVDVIIESDIAIEGMIDKAKVDPNKIKKLLAVKDPNHPEICLAISKQTDLRTVEKLKQAQQFLKASQG